MRCWLSSVVKVNLTKTDPVIVLDHDAQSLILKIWNE